MCTALPLLDPVMQIGSAVGLDRWYHTTSANKIKTICLNERAENEASLWNLVCWSLQWVYQSTSDLHSHQDTNLLKKKLKSACLPVSWLLIRSITYSNSVWLECLYIVENAVAQSVPQHTTAIRGKASMAFYNCLSAPLMCSTWHQNMGMLSKCKISEKQPFFMQTTPFSETQQVNWFISRFLAHEAHSFFLSLQNKQITDLECLVAVQSNFIWVPKRHWY